MTSEEGESQKYQNDFDLTLLSNFIHQVINPLNGVAGTLDNLIDGRIEGVARRQQRMNAARAQLEHCISLVRNLAYFAQGFSSISSSDARSVVVPQTLIEAAMFFQEDASHKKIEIEVLERHKQTKVFGHPELIRQVFMNIFDNVVKYSLQNENVVVQHYYQKKHASILIEIRSISRFPLTPEDAKNVFELGHRGQNAKAMVASGTGLGLYICRRIVEDVHHGKIWLDASRDGRVTFYVRLPAE